LLLLLLLQWMACFEALKLGSGRPAAGTKYSHRW
jgi:hypothetical protein